MIDSINLRLPESSIISREIAHDLLGPFYSDFKHCVRAGLTEFLQIPPSHRAIFRNRTLAGAINDHIVDEATRVFDGNDACKIVDEYECSTFVIGGLVALRFKKIDGESKSKNIQTKRQLGIQWQMPLMDIVSATYVTLGYQLSAAKNEIVGVEISCFFGPSLRWKIPIADDMASYLIDNDLKPVQTIKTPAVRPKKQNVEPRNEQPTRRDSTES